MMDYRNDLLIWVKYALNLNALQRQHQILGFLGLLQLFVFVQKVRNSLITTGIFLRQGVGPGEEWCRTMLACLARYPADEGWNL